MSHQRLPPFTCHIKDSLSLDSATSNGHGRALDEIVAAGHGGGQSDDGTPAVGAPFAFPAPLLPCAVRQLHRTLGPSIPLTLITAELAHSRSAEKALSHLSRGIAHAGVAE